MTIAVDFDGTIVEHRYPAIGREIPCAIDTLKRLSDEGHNIILWSVREGALLEDAVKFCRERGLAFYAVNSERPEDSWERKDVTRKITADIYIDDRNVGGLPDWNMIYRMVSEHASYTELTGRPMRSTHSGKKKKSFLKRLTERCREARRKYAG